MSTAAVILLILVISSVVPITTTSAPIINLDSILTQQSHLDPQATNDSFLSLPTSLKKSLSHSTPFSHKTQTLVSSLNVCLVSNSFPSESSSLRSSFLFASQTSNYFPVITHLMDLLHHLAVKHSLHLDVSHSLSLASQLSNTLRAKIQKTPSSFCSPLLYVPFSLVDRIIKQDFEKEKLVHGAYLYFLDLGTQLKPYAYSYGFGDSSLAFSK